MVAIGLPYSWQQQCASHPCPASGGGRGPSQTEGLVGRAPDTACVVYHMSYCHEMSVCQNCSLLVACGKPFYLATVGLDCGVRASHPSASASRQLALVQVGTLRVPAESLVAVAGKFRVAVAGKFPIILESYQQSAFLHCSNGATFFNIVATSWKSFLSSNRRWRSSLTPSTSLDTQTSASRILVTVTKLIPILDWH